MSSGLLFVAVGACLLAGVRSQDSCYADNPTPYLNFATKTAYEHAYNKKGITSVPDCTPVQVWLVSRHGTRWPKIGAIPEFSELSDLKNLVISNYNANKGSLCLKDIENLKAWNFRLTPDVANLLTQQGKQDLYYLGKRIRSFFPELFNTSSYDPSKFVFRHTDTSRTKESAEYFARGVLGLSLQDASPPLPDALPEDPLIYPYDKCPAYDNQEKPSKVEQKKFYKSDFVNRVIYNVSQRLGFDYNLTLDNVKNIYDGCRYQKAWNVTGISPWCAAFSKEDLDVMEYSEDVKYYYESGPANWMNLRLACPLAKDLFNHFSQIENQPDGQHPQGVFYFTHAAMINMLSARLGLTLDSLPLTADNYPEQQRRDYRTSHIMPFAGNVLAVLYKCSRGEPLQTIFYQAEDIVRYPGCSVGLCEWNYIKQRFASFVQDSACTDLSFCAGSKGGSDVTTAFASLIALLSLFSVLYSLRH